MAYITFASSPQAQMLRKCSTSPTKVDPAPIEASRLLAPQYRLSQSKLYSPMAAAHRGLHWDGGGGGEGLCSKLKAHCLYTVSVPDRPSVPPEGLFCLTKAM